MDRLTPIKFVSRDKAGHQQWRYQCYCGNQKVILQNSVNSGNTKSYGCVRIKLAKIQGVRHIRHGEALDTHHTRTKEYQCWDHIKSRCYNPNTSNFKNYGGRGIIVCDRWLESYENFLNDMGRAPSSKYSIDRINNDGNYEPGNCKWSTSKEQRLNQRKNKNRMSDSIQIKEPIGALNDIDESTRRRNKNVS